MYKILKSEKLADKIYLMDVEAPRVARHCQPGQFIIVKMDEKGERIPLTICDYDREKGIVTIVFQIVGVSTARMAELKTGDGFSDFVGPLGCASELISESIEELKKKSIVFVAGGVGTAPVYPQVKWLHEQGVDVDVIVGAKTKDMLILEVVSFHTFTPPASPAPIIYIITNSSPTLASTLYSFTIFYLIPLLFFLLMYMQGGIWLEV